MNNKYMKTWKRNQNKNNNKNKNNMMKMVIWLRIILIMMKKMITLKIQKKSLYLDLVLNLYYKIV